MRIFTLFIKDDSDQLGFKESTSQYSQKLSTFELWLELAWLGAKCKGKTLLVKIRIIFDVEN